MVHRVLSASLTVLALVGASSPARADGVIERAARTGELVVTGPADMPSILSLDAAGQPQGYAMEFAQRIAAAVATAIGRPVRLKLAPESNPVTVFANLASGKADLVCGVSFSWERDLFVDFSLPIAVSGLKLLAPEGRFDGSAAGLAGRSIGVQKASLGDTFTRGFQPAAAVRPFANLSEAVDALSDGQVDGVIGDSVLLEAQVRDRRLAGMAFTPERPFDTYGVACLVPQNDSAFRDLVNLTIARLLQGYLDGQPEAVAAVDRWIGPGSRLNLSREQIQSWFEASMLGVEAIRPLPAASADSAIPSNP
ncbi:MULTISPECIES: extracellular substrate binding-like orphan protein GrrP [Aphanothece]|uniref:extracellular substrate binding-like orphan protein GrrP n=1 Tax=Aphanothece TaxID=1121 RepID=UPI00398504C6